MGSRFTIIHNSVIVTRGLISILKEVFPYRRIDHLELSDFLQLQEKCPQNDLVFIEKEMLDGYGPEISHRVNTHQIVCIANDESKTTMAAFPCIHLYDDVHNTIDVIRSLCQKSVPEKESEDELSEREKEILCAVAKGLINKEISDEYNISIHTVITHRKNITAKLGIKSISGLTAYALLNDFIMMDDIK